MINMLTYESRSFWKVPVNLCLIIFNRLVMLGLSSIVSRSVNLFKRYPRFYFYGEMRDYYKVLGLTKEATAQQIKKAYYKLAQEYHPDINKAEDAHVRFTEINTAHQILSNPQKKQQQDMNSKYSEKSSRVKPNFRSMFDDEPCFATKLYFAKAGNPLPTQQECQITWFQSLSGCTKTITYHKEIFCNQCNGNRLVFNFRRQKCQNCQGKGKQIFQKQKNCQTCKGRGYKFTNECKKCQGGGFTCLKLKKIDVQIPKRVDLSKPIILEGVGSFGGKLVIKLKISDKYERQGNDAFYTLKISALDAFTGLTQNIYDAEGEELSLFIKAGTQPDTKIEVKGRGYFEIEQQHHFLNQSEGNKQKLRRGRGKIVFTVEIQVPYRPTEQEKKALEKIKQRLKRECSTTTTDIIDFARSYL